MLKLVLLLSKHATSSDRTANKLLANLPAGVQVYTQNTNQSPSGTVTFIRNRRL